MTIPSFTSSPRSLSYPQGYNPLPGDVGEFGSNAKLFAAQDYAILGHQSRLVDRVLAGSISKDEFCRKAGMLEGIEEKRATLRGEGGLTRRERAELRNDLKGLAGKMQAILPERVETSFPSEGSELGLLYDELTAGAVDAPQAVHELHWRSEKKYGEIVAQRLGPVYGDERTKLRAALAEPLPFSQPKLESERQVAENPYIIADGTNRLIDKAIAAFGHIDLNKNGLLDLGEAQNILADYQELGLSAAEAATLYSSQEMLSGLTDKEKEGVGKLSLKDLQALLPGNGLGVSRQAARSALEQVQSRLLDQERRYYPAAEPPLYATNQGPNASKVAQGLEGSCWFLSALPAVESSVLEKALVAEGDHYKMRFADGTSQRVTPLNEAERRVYSRGDGAWSALMEKAVSQKLISEGDDHRGGYPQQALALLTGKSCSVHFLDLRPGDGPDYRDPAALGQLLENTLSKKGAVFVQANSGDFEPGISLISESRHAYTVTGYDAKTGMVSLRNPWGRGEKADKDGVDDGNFQLSLVQMLASFSLVVAEKV